MSKPPAVLTDIVQAIERNARNAAFCEAGTVELEGSTFEIDGIGEVHLPLRPKAVRKLIAAAEQYPMAKERKH